MKFANMLAATSVLAVNLIVQPNALATNTITFNGNVTDATCDVALKYEGAEVGTKGTGTITLNDVSKVDLKTADASAGQVHFYIVAKNCSLGDPAKEFIAATFTSANGDNQGLLNNIAGSGKATNVKLRLLDSKRTFIKVNDPTQKDSTAYSTINTTGTDPETEILYFVEYVSQGDATAGLVSSTVDYELAYK